MSVEEHDQDPAPRHPQDARRAPDARAAHALSHWGHSALGRRDHQGEAPGEFAGGTGAERLGVGTDEQSR